MASSIKHNGRTLRITSKYGWRYSNPNEVDALGKPLSPLMPVIVEIAKTRHWKDLDTGETKYDAILTPAAFQGRYVDGTNVIYAPSKVRVAKGGESINAGGRRTTALPGDRIIETRMFVVMNRKVYSTTVRQYFSPVTVAA